MPVTGIAVFGSNCLGLTIQPIRVARSVGDRASEVESFGDARE
jgi:hypothetical protein